MVNLHVNEMISTIMEFLINGILLLLLVGFVIINKKFQNN